MPSRTHLPYRQRAREKARQATVAKPSPEAQRAREDLAYFGEFVMGKQAMKHHQEWIDALVTYEDSAALKMVAGKNTAILSPRGSAKSTWIGLFVAWVIGHNPDCQIIYCAYSENVSLSRSRLIQRIISSDKFREVFPEVLPGSRWSATDWEIDKSFCGVTDLDSDYTFLAVGAAGSITSKRSKLIIIDDPVKSSESIENPEVLEKLTTNWAEVLRPTLVPGGRVIAIGTRFTATDLFCSTFTEKKGWGVIEQSAIVESPGGGEASYWPERYPLEELQELRELAPTTFQFQFQNKVVRISETSINPDWITRGDCPTDLDLYDTLAIGLDLSPTERERNDYTAFVLAGRIGTQFYVLDCWRGREAGNITKLDRILEMLHDWGALDHKDGRYISTGIPIALFAEDVAYQASLSGDFKQYVVNEKRILNVVYRASAARGTKLSRLRGISGLFENGLVVFNQYRPMGRLIEELTNFGSIDHEDMADALEHVLRGLSLRNKLEAA